MFFSFAIQSNNKILFLDEKKKYDSSKTIVYCKPAFTGVYTNFGNLQPIIYKFSIFHFLACSGFKSSSNWKLFYDEL